MDFLYYSGSYRPKDAEAGAGNGPRGPMGAPPMGVLSGLHRGPCGLHCGFMGPVRAPYGPHCEIAILDACSDLMVLILDSLFRISNILGRP